MQALRAGGGGWEVKGQSHQVVAGLYGLSRNPGAPGAGGGRLSRPTWKPTMDGASREHGQGKYAP